MELQYLPAGVFVIVFSVIPCVLSSFSASFQLVAIVNDTCDESRKLGIETNHRNLYTCGLSCLRQTDCRRMLVCQEGNSSRCTFYQDGDYCVHEGDPSECHCYKKVLAANHFATSGNQLDYKGHRRRNLAPLSIDIYRPQAATCRLRKEKACTDGNSCSCPLGYYGDNCTNIITDCSDGYRRGLIKTDQLMSTIQPPAWTEPFQGICRVSSGAGWTVLMSRDTSNRTCPDTDYNRNWTDYVNGFGSSRGSFWLGLENMHKLLEGYPKNVLMFTVYYRYVNSGSYALCNAYCYNMTLSDASLDYTFAVDGVAPESDYECGKRMRSIEPRINNRPFSTPDNDHTPYDCAGLHRGGWWYTHEVGCSRVNINGMKDELKWFIPITEPTSVYKIQMSVRFDEE